MRSPRRRPRADRSARTLRLGLVASLVLTLVLGMGDLSRGATPAADSGSTGPTLILERIWPDYPEWLAMLAEILSGRTLKPGLGWFRKAVSKSRFDWPGLAGRLDGNRDGAIDRAEFRGRVADFDHLDRDRDGVVTAADLDFSDRNRDGADVEAFLTADADGDGKLTRPELTAFSRQTAADPIYRLVFAGPGRELEARLGRLERQGSAFLTLSDFQEAFALTARRDGSTGGGVRPPVPRKVDTPALLRAFLRREIGAFGPGPALNARAPDFTLGTVDGGREIGLAGLVGSKPVVLLFGNYTCGPFRGHAGSLERLHARYRDRAHFVVVYTRESHPVDGWQFEENRSQGIAVAQPRDLPRRSTVARTCRERLGLAMPVVVDSMDDRVGSLYSGPPSRAYLIDREGKIAYKGGRGPFGFEPASLEQSLILLLQSDPPAGDAMNEESPASSDATPMGERGDSRDPGKRPWLWVGVAVGMASAIGLAWSWSRRSPGASTDSDTP